jgi:hypothetical protein
MMATALISSWEVKRGKITSEGVVLSFDCLFDRRPCDLEEYYNCFTNKFKSFFYSITLTRR